MKHPRTCSGIGVIVVLGSLISCRVDEEIEPAPVDGHGVVLCQQLTIIYGGSQDTIVAGPGTEANSSVIWADEEENETYLSMHAYLTAFPSGDPDAGILLHADMRARDSTGFVARPPMPGPPQYFEAGDTLFPHSELHSVAGLYYCGPGGYSMEAGPLFLGFVQLQNGDERAGFVEVMVEPITVEGFCEQYRYRFVRLVVADCPGQPIVIQ